MYFRWSLDWCVSINCVSNATHPPCVYGHIILVYILSTIDMDVENVIVDSFPCYNINGDTANGCDSDWTHWISRLLSMDHNTFIIRHPFPLHNPINRWPFGFTNNSHSTNIFGNANNCGIWFKAHSFGLIVLIRKWCSIQKWKFVPGKDDIENS